MMDMPSINIRKPSTAKQMTPRGRENFGQWPLPHYYTTKYSSVLIKLKIGVIRLNPLDQVVTASEASRMLNVTIQHITRLCRERKLIARRSDDRIWLILRSSVEAYRAARNEEGERS